MNAQTAKLAQTLADLLPALESAGLVGAASRVEFVLDNLPKAQEESPDRGEQLAALTLYGWTVHKVSLYDEEGVDGWTWTSPNGTEHTEIGDWSELPPWPDSARAALALTIKGKP